MASTGIGQRFPKPAITLIIVQALSFYSVIFNLMLGGDYNFEFSNILSLVFFIFFAITILARKRKVGMLISTICVALYMMSNQSSMNNFFTAIINLCTVISSLCLIDFAIANLSSAFEKTLGLSRVLFRIAFITGLSMYVLSFLTTLPNIIEYLEYDFAWAFTFVFTFVLGILRKIAMFKIGLWMADVQFTKPVRKNAYLFDAEPPYFKRNFQ